jgi:hypothetical protein
MSLYKREADRIQDVFVASSVANRRPTRAVNGNVQMVDITPYEKAIFREETAAALTRLFLDKLMKSVARGAI